MKPIRKVIVSGFFWTILNQITTNFVAIGVSAILARLITPSEFGVVGMVGIATGFLNVIKDFGFGAALVQKKQVSDDEYSTVFWLNLFTGAILMAIVFIAAPWIASFFNEPRLLSVSRLMSGTFLINSFGIIWSNQLIRQVAFKQIFIRSLVSLCLSGAIGIFIAVSGHGIEALIAQSYCNIIINLALNYLRVKWLPTFTFRREYLRGLMSFSLPLLGEMSFNYWVRNIDNLLIGKFLGKESLAYYNKSYSLMLLPVRQLSGTLNKVLFPAFSLIQDDKSKIADIYLRTSRLIAFCSFPLMICLSVLAEPLILFLYGEQWIASVKIFKVLSLLGMFQAIGTLTANVYLAQGKTKLLFKFGLLVKSTMIVGIVIGLVTGGLMGIVYGYCIASAIVFLPDLYLVGRLLELPLMKIILNFFTYLVLGVVMGALVWMGYVWFPLSGHLISLSVYGFLGAAIYLLLSFIFNVPALADILTLVRTSYRNASSHFS